MMTGTIVLEFNWIHRENDRLSVWCIPYTNSLSSERRCSALDVLRKAEPWMNKSARHAE
jgi:hypothetical protein